MYLAQLKLAWSTLFSSLQQINMSSMIVSLVKNPAPGSWQDPTARSCRILPQDPVGSSKKFQDPTGSYRIPQDPGQDPTGYYRILRSILKNPAGPFEDFFMILNISQVYYRIFKGVYKTKT